MTIASVSRNHISPPGVYKQISPWELKTTASVSDPVTDDCLCVFFVVVFVSLSLKFVNVLLSVYHL